MTWFQKILVAIPYLIYGVFFYLVTAGGRSVTFGDILGFVFVGGFVFITIPALVGFFIHLAFYKRISFLGGFIITHWFFLLAISGGITYKHVSSLFSGKVVVVEPKIQPVYSGEKLEIERIAKSHVRNNDLQNQSHVYYFIKMIKDTTSIESYTVYYFFNLSNKSDTSKARAIKMRVNAAGMVSFNEQLKVKDDKIANDMFHDYYGFYEWLLKVAETADGNPETIISLTTSDSSNIKEWLRKLDMTDCEFSIK